MRKTKWNDHKLSYRQPAANWNEALPVGNGRLGGMVFGGIGAECIQLNEDTLWSGGPREWNNPHSREVLPLVRQALFEGRYQDADALCKQMQGPFTQSYLPMGNLYLEFDQPGTVTGYSRELDLDRALTCVRYQAGDATFTRQVFASFPDQVIAIHLTCDLPNRLTFSARLDSLLHYQVEAPKQDILVLKGRCPNHVEPSYRTSEPAVVYTADGGATFEIYLKAINHGGKVWIEEGSLKVKDANRVTLLISAATSFNGYDKNPYTAGLDPSIRARAYLEQAASEKTYMQLFRRHVADHQSLFRRVALDLGVTNTASQPTDQRLKAFHEQDDPHLVTLIFQMGRYLMIASSRPGTQPANLQGIWNEHLRAPWSSNYTTNINTEMNYWPVETCNLAECHQPLFDMIGDLAVTGSLTAKVNYGCRGWVAHHNVDLWRQSAPVGAYGEGSPQWANWPMAGAWLCQHLWEHYSFDGDLAFLRDTAWPLMRGAAEFCLDWLIDDGQGHLVTAPSGSPENSFRLPDGEAQISIATSMDMAIIWDLFTNCIEALELLGIEPDFRDALVGARQRLFPPQVGRYGQLQEWSVDWDSTDEHHRHISHLFGLHPGRQITRYHLPELIEAVKTSLRLRGDYGTGWSLGWKINCWARLHDGDHAYTLLGNQLTYIDSQGFDYHRGGTYPNLLDAHPPFQIDGNFAASAGIAEMLLQSHAGEIELLPALSASWPTGQIKGLRARRGFTVDIAWRNNRLAWAALHSHLGNSCRLRTNRPVHITCEGQPVELVDVGNGVVKFETLAGKIYRVH